MAMDGSLSWMAHRVFVLKRARVAFIHYVLYPDVRNE
jgi:hypothetical protein